MLNENIGYIYNVTNLKDATASPLIKLADSAVEHVRNFDTGKPK